MKFPTANELTTAPIVDLQPLYDLLPLAGSMSTLELDKASRKLVRLKLRATIKELQHTVKHIQKRLDETEDD